MKDLSKEQIWELVQEYPYNIGNALCLLLTAPHDEWILGGVIEHLKHEKARLEKIRWEMGGKNEKVNLSDDSISSSSPRI